MLSDCRPRARMCQFTLTHALLILALVAGLGATRARAADPPDVAPGVPDTTTPTAVVATPDSTETRVPLPDRVVVYYFHRTLRCDTCLKFEAYTDEALGAAFADELGDGTLEWHVVNLDEHDFEHFVDDYYITESSVIAVEFLGGEQQEWTNLDAIWGFVGDKPTFLSYIQNEVASRLTRVVGREPTNSSVSDTIAPSNEAPAGR